jgi:hypothetical protein
MSYAKHLFISYSHIDDKPLSDHQQGWITRFHHGLSAMLSVRLGKEVSIWRDNKLSGNDIFADEILAQFPSTELMVSIISPRYVQSEWCTREAKEFCKAAEQTGGVVVGNKARVIKVIKLPAECEDLLPEVLRQELGYPFYFLDENQVPIELDPAYGEEFAQKYNRKLATLSHDIAQFIKKLEADSATTTGAANNAPRPRIYLSECSYDRRDDRESIATDLRFQGYDVYPDKALPREEDAYVDEVKQLLAKCELSIHLFGSKCGFIPDGPSDRSASALQNELAAARAKTTGLLRVVWLPEGTRAESPEHQAFLDSLLQDTEPQFGADLLTGTREELKLAVRAALKKLEDMRTPPPQEAADSRLIYLICEQRDRKATISLRKSLLSHGWEIQLPVFEGDPAEVRKANEEVLAACDAVLLFYGAGDEAWKRCVEFDLRRALSYRRGKRLLAQYTYLAEPATSDKEDRIELGEPNLINALSGFSEQGLEPFINELKA